MEGISGKFISDHAMEMIVVFGTDGMITYANEATKERLGYESGLEGYFIYELLPGVFRSGTEGFESTAYFGYEPQRLMLYRKNRTCFRVDARLLARKEESPVQYYCMMRDVSNQYALERRAELVAQEAEDTQRLKTEFVANITHELRTPVNGIAGNIAELIRCEEDPKKLETLRIVEKSCQNMNQIISNILDFSKLDAGKVVLELRSFDFRNMMNYVQASHRSKANEKGLEFFVSVSPAIPKMIIGDELRIVQILNNLLSNAWKFTSVGKINVEVIKTAQEERRIELVFVVADTGIGIAKKDEEKLFRSFSQVDASITRKFGGTGLGLSITKQLVDLMGGTISVTSEPGQGTMFTFAIWVELPEGENGSIQVDHSENVIREVQKRVASEGCVQEYGTEANAQEIEKQLSKLRLAVELENWEKAENFVEGIRLLTVTAPKEVRSVVLRLKMAVQRADADRIDSCYQQFLRVLKDTK